MNNKQAKNSISGRRKAGHPVLGLLCSSPFAAVAYFCKYVLPGYSFTAVVCAGIIGVILFYSFMPMVGTRFPRFASILTNLVTVCLVIGLLVCAVTEGFIAHAAYGTPDEQADYLVVLGAKVNSYGPSVSLQDRINGAYEYLVAHPNVIAVVSGGQGTDEVITEAECMALELQRMGISPDRIWKEDRATSTDENIRFSLDLIESQTGTRPAKLAILSSEYHLLRASLMAKKLGIEFVGVPAQTSKLSQLINHGMREIAAVWHFILLGS